MLAQREALTQRPAAGESTVLAEAGMECAGAPDKRGGGHTRVQGGLSFIVVFLLACSWRCVLKH